MNELEVLMKDLSPFQTARTEHWDFHSLNSLPLLKTLWNSSC